MAGRSLFDRPPIPPPPPPPTDPRVETAPAVRSGSAKAPWSVRELSDRIREVIEDGFPRRVWVEGELSHATEARSGHLYLSFREGQTILEAVAWVSDARHFDFRPRPGDRVRAFGQVGAFAGKSRYQLQVRRLERAGIGALLQELAEREARLEAEGLFDPARKRTVPYLPLRIGLLTAVGSDAWVDFTTTARTRFPGVRIRERNTPVQGAGAPAALAAGIRALGREPLDVIVVARGGGSVEDLLPFSDEAVVRAAAACPAPLVSAIGHEKNRPLLDRVADQRASTPSAAARELLPERSELVRELEDRQRAAGGAARRRIRTAEERLQAFLTHRAIAALPSRLAQEGEQRARDRRTAREAAHRAVRLREDRLRTIGLRLERAHPARKLAEQHAELSRTREGLAGLSLLRAQEDRVAAARSRVSPEPLLRRIGTERAALASRWARLSGAATRNLERRRFLGAALRERTESLDPRAVLRRGYSMALDSGGRAVLSAAGVEVGDRLRLLLAAGELGARVEDIRPGRRPTGECP